MRIRSTAFKRILFIAALGLVLAEIAEWRARIFLSERFHGVDPRVFYYPKLAHAGDLAYSRDTLNVAILGSSVTSQGIFPDCLQAKLDSALAKPVAVYNLSYIGSTIRDAYLIYKWLGSHKFDAIVIHQAIGDMRLNQYLDTVAADYANLTWFRRREDVERYYHPWFQLPCAVAWGFTSRAERRQELFRDWNYRGDAGRGTGAGSVNVGLAAYRDAYAGLLDQAHRRSEMAFCVSLAYRDTARNPFYPPLVREFNQAIAGVAAAHGGVFIDVSGLIGRDSLYTDLHHLNPEGLRIMAGMVAEGMVRAGLGRRPEP